MGWLITPGHSALTLMTLALKRNKGWKRKEKGSAQIECDIASHRVVVAFLETFVLEEVWSKCQPFEEWCTVYVSN